ncbi:MAG TPA: hypothetical protein VE777_05515 [Gaiellales bacterium]|jgi:hypothetical protein|nr:hypothetical protein [Gaiellales bacterium]
MARFSIVRRQLLGDEKARTAEWTPERTREDEAPSEPAQTSSRLGALLVLLVPFAIAAWIAIGWAIYDLVT